MPCVGEGPACLGEWMLRSEGSEQSERGRAAGEGVCFQSLSLGILRLGVGNNGALPFWGVW